MSLIAQSITNEADASMLLLHRMTIRDVHFWFFYYYYFIFIIIIIIIIVSVSFLVLLLACDATPLVYR